MKKMALAFLILASTMGAISAPHCRAADRIQGSGKARIEVRNLSGFKKVVAGGAVNIAIVAQKDFGVTVEADDNLLPILKTEINGDTLRIYSTNDYTTQTRINVGISLPEIDGLEISGASVATITNAKTAALALNSSGAAEIKIDGTVDFLAVDASGSSKINAEPLRAVNAKINASGSSQVIVAVTEQIDATTSGSSRVFYLGNPRNLQQNISGSSSITQK